MPPSNPQVLLLMCNNCKGMTAKLLPEIQLQFSEKLRVLPVTCPSQIDPFAVVKLLKKSVNGVIVACPKETCCCPENKKVIKRREIIKDILPIFGLHPEQFQLASVSPFGDKELSAVIEQMINILSFSEQNENRYELFDYEKKVSGMYGWIN